MGRFSEKVCVITGASRGIGRAIAERFAQEGATVIAGGVARNEAPDWIASSKHEGPVEYMHLDVRDSDAVFATMREVAVTHGKIDVLVNNAGVQYSELIGMSQDAHTRQMLEVNTYGTLVLSRHASRIMQQQREGCIINIASAVAIHGNAGQSAYAASKGAVISYTKSAAKELARYGIRVNAIAPGLVDTDMLRASYSEKLQDRIKRIPLGRLATPADIAAACAFLASEDATYITGQVIAVDGGAIL